MPSIVALLLWIVASGYLVFQGFYTRAVAQSVRQVSIPAVSALASIQQERRLSIAYLTRPTKDLQELLTQRRQTDQLLTQLRSVANSALANAPDSIVSGWKALTGYLDQLPSTRSTIDSRSTTQQRIYTFYNQLLDAATNLFDTQARVVPDVTATQGGLAAVQVFRLSDMMSRAGSIVDGAFGSAAFDQQDYLDFVQLVNAYRSSLQDVAPHLQPDLRQRYQDITASEPWKDLNAAEDSLVLAGAWHNGVPRTLAVDWTRWDTLTGEVSDDLIQMTITQADEVSAAALHTGDTQLLTAVLGSVIALAVAVAAILWAVRQSQVLVDRALSVRLARLAGDAATMVDERLPALMERLRQREPVDIKTELAAADYGTDEIGQVAGVINRSVQAAAGAAVDEARTRAAGLALLMGVARRPQRPLQHGLMVIENLQTRTGDEALLSQFFDIHHQLTQTRRFLENLIILAGGQIGRRFPNPLPLRRVLLSAFAETQDYQRIQLRSAADVTLAGQAVTGTIHLVAELLDNALAFSQPGSAVWVSCRRVNHGVAVEIEDAGVGMTPDGLHRANELLAAAPNPDVTALRDGAQIGLHVVAELANRAGITVSLRTSAYGGLLAIVLLPDRLLATEQMEPPNGRGSGVPAVVGAATGPAVNSGRRNLPAAAVAAVTLSNGSAVGLRGTVGTGLYPDPGGTPAGPQWTEGAGAPVQQEEAPDTAGAADGEPPPLPHRQPQSHLAPGLRRSANPQAQVPAPEAAAAPGAPPRDFNRFAQYRQGWADGRSAETSDEPVTGADQGREA
ncbi:MAG TPA: nitrate- and nitrite sensing domain-containing protein [Rugosimonospora sp.]|nr:nitrate- and nitrite sensing domain-containing protein [Rugosimonospora sp.]